MLDNLRSWMSEKKDEIDAANKARLERIETNLEKKREKVERNIKKSEIALKDQKRQARLKDLKGRQRENSFSNKLMNAAFNAAKSKKKNA